MIIPERCLECKWCDRYGGCQPPGKALAMASLVHKYCPYFERRIGRQF